MSQSEPQFPHLQGNRPGASSEDPRPRPPPRRAQLWGQWKTPPPHPVPGPRCRPAERKVSVHVTAPPPQLAPASGARPQPRAPASGQFLTPQAGSGPRALTGFRAVESSAWGEGGAGQPRKPRPHKRNGGQSAPAATSYGLARRVRTANQEERLAGGANQVPECASRGKRTALERGARGGSRQDLKPDRPGVRPMARHKEPGGGKPRDQGE